MAELERERAAVVEIDKCDPKALAEVKSSIADNATQLKMREEEVADIQKDINGSTKRGEDFQAEQKTLQQKIKYVGRMVIHSSTKQDLFTSEYHDIMPHNVAACPEGRKFVHYLSSQLLEMERVCIIIAPF